MKHWFELILGALAVGGFAAYELLKPAPVAVRQTPQPAQVARPTQQPQGGLDQVEGQLITAGTQALTGALGDLLQGFGG